MFRVPMRSRLRVTHLRWMSSSSSSSSSPSPVSIVRRAEESFRDKTAIWKDENEQYSYEDVLETSERIAKELLRRSNSKDLKETCVSFMCPPSFEYVAMQWGIWRAGGVAVPLCTDHSVSELQYVLQDSNANIVMSHKDFTDRIESARTGLDCDLFEVSTENMKNQSTTTQLPSSFGDEDRGALMIYTSGTTGKPKGVLSTHTGLEAQITSLVNAWGWSENDRILNVLPLHHVHGVVNVVSCALYSGAIVEMPGKFDADHVWKRFQSDELSLFMAVPTVYSKLISHWEEKFDTKEQEDATEAASRLRLMVSGSAALPNSVFKRWQHVGGHTLLERYGMTEIGMALSNPLEPIEARRPGCVGLPLPGVEVRIVEGELRVRGPAVFREYWGKPEATKSEFDDEGWFKTGDIAKFDETENAYRILGRASVDIIKSGGYKLSALDIERVLLENENIAEVAVVGLDDEEWGQRVAAQIVQRSECKDEMTLKELRDWCSSRMAKYKMPSELRVVSSIEKNAMGKINKKQLVKNW
eukprot:g1317.t1